MYLEAEAEKYLDASKEIIQRLHAENGSENFILNTRFKECYFPAHAENLSLKFAFSGNEFYEYANRKVTVTPSNFLIVNEGQEHASWIESEDWVNSFAIYFTPFFIASTITDLLVSDEKLLDDPFELVKQNGAVQFFQSLIPFTPRFIARVEHFKRYLEGTAGGEKLIVDEQLRHLFSDLMDSHHRQLMLQVKKISAKKKSTQVEVLKRIHIARDFIESFYTLGLSIDDISTECALSQNLLMRYFRSVFGLSPHQYIINKRLMLARELILVSEKPISEITYSVGFESPSSFGRLFKDRFGVSPEGFRKFSAKV